MSRPTARPRSLAGRSLLALLALLAIVAGLLTAVGAAPPSPAAPARAASARCPQLRLAERWAGDNAARIQAVVDREGTCRRGGPRVSTGRPYAVFDFDNTLIKNDISDQTLFWALRHDALRQPPGRDWRRTSRWMTGAGARALRRACASQGRPGERLRTSGRDRRSVRCADEILSVRLDEVTTDGADVFAGYHHRRMQAMYAWVGQLWVGSTPEQVRDVARRARRAALRAPVGATQRVGSSRQTAWIRYYPEMRDLVRTLRRAGIEPWIVSASPVEYAQVWGPGLGIDADHTIGVTQLVRGGRLTGHLVGCGGIPDGAGAIMTYVDGKRCFVNQEVRGVVGRRALRPLPRAQRPVLVGGDATTDVSMLLDASGVHVVLDRKSPELMCLALDDADGRWVVNPMFVQPAPREDEPYPCSTTARTDADGSPGPVRRPDGSVVPDQVDSVGSVG